MLGVPGLAPASGCSMGNPQVAPPSARASAWAVGRRSMFCATNLSVTQRGQHGFRVVVCLRGSMACPLSSSAVKYRSKVSSASHPAEAYPACSPQAFESCPRQVGKDACHLTHRLSKRRLSWPFPLRSKSHSFALLVREPLQSCSHLTIGRASDSTTSSANSKKINHSSPAGSFAGETKHGR